MKVMKFGGSSVSSLERIRAIIEIIEKSYHPSSRLAIVVSALGGATDELIQIGSDSLQGRYEDRLNLLRERHFSVARHLVDPQKAPALLEKLSLLFQELDKRCKGIMLLEECSSRSKDDLMSYGERLSALIITEAIKEKIPKAEFLDGRTLIKTDSNYGAAMVDYCKSNALIQEWFGSNDSMPIITGFIASNDRGETTTLGRGGSDYTAAIFGAALNAEEIEIWSDVDGVLTADPRKVKHSFSIPEMSYKEALEMSHFGSKVIYPPTIAPALNLGIPLRIKNSFNPSASGTLITASRRNDNHLICGLSSIDRVALLRVEGCGMVGVCGTSKRLFGALAEKKINIIMISQGSSEHSICLAVDYHQAKIAKEAIEKEFALEQHAGLVDSVFLEDNVSIIAAVGENMRQTPGIAGRIFGTLGRNNINVIALTQGSSEYNISLAIRAQDEAKALNAIHDEFFQTPISTCHLFLVGAGLIGSTLLRQIKQNQELLLNEYGLEVKVVAIANSKVMEFNAEGFDLSQWREKLDKATETMEINIFREKAAAMNLECSVFVDCTSSEVISEAYASILRAGISIVTPNKKANSGSYARYRELKELSKRRGVKFLYETNVGAGLPIINTFIDLMRTGDKIIKIEAILSGTLSYLFNAFQEGKSFSETLLEAQRKEFTEPDPREDLNGNDVKRKLLILARESGYPLELKDIEIEPLLPKECFEAESVTEFYEKLAAHDPKFEEQKNKAMQKGKVLRYIASFSEGKTAIKLQEVDRQHPFYNLQGSDNIISIYTEKYCDTPLVIKGAGAGAEVTAGEVFAEIIKIAI